MRFAAVAAPGIGPKPELLKMGRLTPTDPLRAYSAPGSLTGFVEEQVQVVGVNVA